MTRIIISHLRKCHGNYYEGAGGYELKIAQSGCFFGFLVLCVSVFVIKEQKIVLTLGTFFHLTAP